MAYALNRTTKEFLPKVNTPDYDPAVWLINPDLTPVEGHDPRIWVIQPDDTLRLMTDAEIDAEYLDDFQTLWRDKINTERTTRIAGRIWYMGYCFDTDDTSRTNVTATVSALGAGMTLPANFTWRTYNNINVPMNATQVKTFGILMLAYVQSLYQYSWYLKAQVDAATTRNQVRAIDVTAGWPSNNMDGSKPADA